MEDSLSSGCHRRSGPIRINTEPGSFTTDQTYRFITDKFIEHTHGITSTSNACHNDIRQFSFFFQYLRSRFLTDHALEITHDRWKRMRSHNRAKHIQGIIHTADPLSHTFINGILKRHRATLYRMHFGTQQFHTIYIQCLTDRIFFTHKDLTIQI